MAKNRRTPPSSSHANKVGPTTFIEPIDAHKIDSPTQLIKQLLSLQTDLENCIPPTPQNIELEYDKNKLNNERKDVASNPFLSSDSLTSLLFKRKEDEQRFAHELSDLELIGLPLDDVINKHKQTLAQNNHQSQLCNFEQEFQNLSNKIIKQTMEEYMPKVEKIMRHRLTLAAQQIIKKQNPPNS